MNSDSGILMTWTLAAFLAVMPSRSLAAECAVDPATGIKDAECVIASWPEATKSAARAMIEKYGPPDNVLLRWLEWYPAGWYLVRLYRDPVPDNEPVPHRAFIENTIQYQVPPDKVAALAAFDSALVVDRLRGLISSNTDSEKNNILALNLAHEVATGKRNAASARDFRAKTTRESMAGKSSPYTETLMFTAP
jgi:hypothetical protein